jgi:hypothetical protein
VQDGTKRPIFGPEPDVPLQILSYLQRICIPFSILIPLQMMLSSSRMLMLMCLFKIDNIIFLSASLDTTLSNSIAASEQNASARDVEMPHSLTTKHLNSTDFTLKRQSG